MTAARTRLLAGLLLAALTVAVYWPVTGYDYIWDDEHYVQYNTTLRTAGGLADIWLDPHATPQYYPLVHTSYWIEYRLWGLAPRGYHTTNVVLHALATVLLWLVLRRLEVPGAWVAAAVFGVHPVGVESVAWITERKNVLALVFYLASALAFLTRALDPERRKSRGLYAVSLACFLAALFSKTVACSLPASLLLVLWWKQGRASRRTWIELAPFFVLGVALGLVTVWLEKVQVGAAGADWDLSFVERCLIAGRALWFYAGKLLWPTNLVFFYHRWEIDAGRPWQYLYPAAALGVLATAWVARGRVGRGPFVALLVFGGTLVPALGFFDVYPMRFSWVADHFQYLASPALIALVVGAGATALQRPGEEAVWPGRAIAAVAVCALAVLNWQHQPQFRNLDTLWRTTLEKNPTSWAAAHNLGMELSDADRSEEAMVYFRRALEIRPGYAEAGNALALELAGAGREREAALQYRSVLEANPDDRKANSNLAKLLATSRDPELRDLAEAERLALHARSIDEERSAKVLLVLALVYQEQERFVEAAATARDALAVALETRDSVMAAEARNRIGFYELLEDEPR